MSGCVFSVLLQKVKIKIQNDVIVHQSASLSVNEDVRINFKQSNQCFNALKCPKIVKKFGENYGAPPPPCLESFDVNLCVSGQFDENYGAPPPPCLERAAAAADDLTKLVFLEKNVDLRESECQSHWVYYCVVFRRFQVKKSSLENDNRSIEKLLAPF